jgi:hypothetical protein
MQQSETLYKAVAWDKPTSTRPCRAAPPAPRRSPGYMDGYNECTKKVKPLIAKVTELQNKAAVTETKFKATKTIPSSSTAHVGKVQEAAKLFAAQATMVRSELEAFNKASALPAVQDSVGSDWFVKLGRIKFYTNAQLLAWTTNADWALLSPFKRLMVELSKY